jgi:hypothetical protein
MDLPTILMQQPPPERPPPPKRQPTFQRQPSHPKVVTMCFGFRNADDSRDLTHLKLMSFFTT